MKTSKLLLPILIATLITACSSTTEDKIAQINEAELEIQQDRVDLEQEKREKEADDMPDWVLNLPAPDATGYYAIGYGESKSIFKAIKKSTIQAEFGLAKAIKQEISGSERAFEKDSGAGTEQELYTVVIDKIVDSVQVVGFTQVAQELISSQGIHTVYTLLKMPYEQYNKILANQRTVALEQESKDAFSELEDRINKRQQQRVEEGKLKHKQQMDIHKLENEKLKLTTENSQTSVSSKKVTVNDAIINKIPAALL